MNLLLNKTTIVLFTCIVLRLNDVSGQSSGLTNIANFWEINANIGANEFLGDVGGNTGRGGPLLKDYKVKSNRLLVGLSGTYNVSNFLAVNTGFNLSQIANADSLISNTGNMERWRWYRNLSFKSNVYELYATATFYPVLFFNRKKEELFKINPYVSVGAGVLHFNPKANLNGTWYELQPLQLEGQSFEEYPDRKPYSRTQFYIPLNVGIKYYFNDRWGLSAGVLMRKTFTDYMDDISTTYIDPALFYKYFPTEKASIAEQLYSRSRTPWKVKPGVDKGDPNDMDTYFTAHFTLSIRLDKRMYIYYPKL